MWVQRGAGPTKQIIFSSTFDSVLSGEAGPNELYTTTAEPSVTAASEGKVGCVLCIGPASEEKKAAVFGGPLDVSAEDQMGIAARAISEMVPQTHSIPATHGGDLRTLPSLHALAHPTGSPHWLTPPSHPPAPASPLSPGEARQGTLTLVERRALVF